MARNDMATGKNMRMAIAFTAVMGVALAALALVREQFGDSDVLRVLWVAALVAVMVGGVSTAYFARGDNE